MKKYKTNKINLLFTLYELEDKTQYKSKSLSRYIDKLQKNIKIRKV